MEEGLFLPKIKKLCQMWWQGPSQAVEATEEPRTHWRDQRELAEQLVRAAGVCREPVPGAAAGDGGVERL